MTAKTRRKKMDSQPDPDKTEPSEKKQYGVKVLKKQVNFSLPQAVTFVAAFALIGGFILIKSFAASPIPTTVAATNDAVPGQLMLKFEPNATKAQRDKILKDNNLDVTSE